MRAGYDMGTLESAHGMQATHRSYPLPAQDRRPLSVGRILIDPDRFETLVDGRRITLTLSEFRLLQLLARRPGRVFPPQSITSAMEAVGAPISRTGLKNHVWMLRRKLGDASDQLRTIRGVGYSLAEA